MTPAYVRVKGRAAAAIRNLHQGRVAIAYVCKLPPQNRGAMTLALECSCTHGDEENCLDQGTCGMSTPHMHPEDGSRHTAASLACRAAEDRCRRALGRRWPLHLCIRKLKIVLAFQPQPRRTVLFLQETLSAVNH
jgi:hypothetical protein